MAYVDFAELKERMSIQEAVELLGLDMKKTGEQLRCKCPACGGDNERTLVVTPSKGVFFCFADQKGGDLIALTAHIQGSSTKDAAAFLAGKPSEEKRQAKPSEGFKPLEYLQPEHDAVQAVGFDADIAERLGVGFAPRGVLKGTVAVPVRLADGTLSGYIGITEATLPPKWA